MSSSYRNNNRAGQGGAALIVALLVVIVVVTLVTRMSSAYLLLFRSLENQQQVQTIHSYLRSTETLASKLLLLDLQTNNQSDSLLDVWAQPLSLPLPEGVLEACVRDAQGKLNLNDLGAPVGEGYSSAQKRFIRLLQVLPLEPALTQSQAISLAHAVFDWADVDTNTRTPGGAETQDYLRQGAHYRAANQGFASVSELVLVAGMAPELVRALTPYLSVWGNGSMNLNSLDPGLQKVAVSTADSSLKRASESTTAILLRTLNNADSLLPLAAEVAVDIALLRQSAGGVVTDLSLFRQGSLRGQTWDLEGLGLISDFFTLQARLSAGKRYYGLVTVLQRRLGASGRPEVVVKSRTFENITPGVSACDFAVP